MSAQYDARGRRWETKREHYTLSATEGRRKNVGSLMFHFPWQMSRKGVGCVLLVTNEGTKPRGPHVSGESAREEEEARRARRSPLGGWGDRSSEPTRVLLSNDNRLLWRQEASKRRRRQQQRCVLGRPPPAASENSGASVAERVTEAGAPLSPPSVQTDLATR